MKNYTKTFLGLSVSLLMVGSFSSCYYDNLEVLNPTNNTCDSSSAITYTKQIEPIITKQCITGCHSASANSGGIILDSYATAKTCGQTGRLVGSTASSSATMPKGGSKLSDCDIAILKKWVATNYAQ